MLSRAGDVMHDDMAMPDCETPLHIDQYIVAGMSRRQWGARRREIKMTLNI